MAEQQKSGQPARDQGGQGKPHESKHRSQSDQWPSYTPQAETDNEFPEDPAASQGPSFTPQGRTDNEFPDEDEEDADKPSTDTAVPPPPGTNPQNPGRSGGTGQGGTDHGGEGRIPQ